MFKLINFFQDRTQTFILWPFDNPAGTLLPMVLKDLKVPPSATLLAPPCSSSSSRLVIWILCNIMVPMCSFSRFIKFEKKQNNYLFRGPKALDPMTSKSACKFSAASPIFSFGSPTTTWVFTFTYAPRAKIIFFKTNIEKSNPPIKSGLMSYQ